MPVETIDDKSVYLKRLQKVVHKGHDRSEESCVENRVFLVPVNYPKSRNVQKIRVGSNQTHKKLFK